MKFTFAICLLLGSALSVFGTPVAVPEQEIRAEGPTCPLPDPLRFDAAPLNASFHPIFEIFPGGTHGPVTMLGLSTLWFNVEVNILFLTATFHIKVGEIDITTDYSAEGWVDCRPLRQETLPSGNFSGSGPSKVQGQNIEIIGDMTVFVNLIGNKVTIRILNLDTITLDSLILDFGPEFVIAGAPYDWLKWAESFKDNFNADMDANKDQIVDKIRQTANNFVEQFTLQELIDMISGEDRCNTASHF